MANNFEIKTKTFFQIPPRLDADKDRWIDRVVFMQVGFDLNDIMKISEVHEIRKLHYEFYVRCGHIDDMVLTFDFVRKGDALMVQRELTRAWTRTGEFAYSATNEEGTEQKVTT